jgi:hypothetical protein
MPPREVAGHRVHVVGEIVPHAVHALHFRLAAHFAVGADLAGHTRDFGGKRAKLIHHSVNGLGGPQEFTLQRTLVDL